jgi:hypothetical protein
MGLIIRRGQMPKFKWRPEQFQQGTSFTKPAPYAGINLRSAITALEPTEARVLENWFPDAGNLTLRPGYDPFAVGMGLNEVKTLAAFVGYTASELLAAANGAIYEVTDGTYADGNDTYTKVLLPFTGTDGGTTITDVNVGGSAHTWTAAGNANTDNAQSKFGGTSLACDGTGDWVTTADHADFSLGTSEFTVDVWARPAADGTQIRIAGQADSGLAAATSAWYIERLADNTIKAFVSNGSSFTSVTSVTTVLAGAWTHIALERTSNTLSLSINGGTPVTASFSGTVPNVSVALRVGAAGEATGNPWNGWLDEFRLSVGVSRWDGAAFTVPTVPHSPTVLASGFSDDRWQTALYQDRLFWVNGTDNPQLYDGSAVSAAAWTGSGLTDNDLINVALVRNRLWFCEKNKAHVWYADIGQINPGGSALTKFQLEQIAGGGICMAIGSWSRDGGDGADDLTVFVMSTGEILLYQGDPATTFALIGRYEGAPPIGRQCLVKVGGELVIITRLGLLPMSAAVGGVALDLARIDPWGKVAAGIAADAVLDGGNAGWHAILHNGVFYLNVPQSTGVLSKQWILNTRTGAWTTYSGLNASRFCSFNDEVYFGAQDDGTVHLVGGSNDDGEDITTNANDAFVYPSQAQNTNTYLAIRPKMTASGTITGLIGVDTDFVIRTLTGATVPLFDDISTTPWGSPWGSSWGAATEGEPQWFSIVGHGKAVSVRLRATGQASDLKWYATDVLMKPGGIR